MKENNKSYSKDKSIIKKPIIREFLPGFISLIGCVLSVPVLAFLVIKATKYSALHIITYSIFGASIFFLYLFNTLYYFISKDGKEINTLKKFTHITGYFYLIGLFIPYMLCVVCGPWGWSMFGVITLLGLLGIIFSSIWINWPVALRITYLSLAVPAIAIAIGLISNKFYCLDVSDLFLIEMILFIFTYILRYIKRPRFRFFSYKMIALFFSILLNAANYMILNKYFD